MAVEASARGVPVRLEASMLLVGGRRIPRSRIRGVEFDSRGRMLVLGKSGVLALIDFDPEERAALARVEKALAPRERSLQVALDQASYRPGELIRGSVDLSWPKARPVRGVRVGLIGAERTEIRVRAGSGKHSSSRTYREYRPLIGQERDLFGIPPVSGWRAGGDALRRLLGRQDYPVLPAGRHRYEFAFQLPPGAPPSFTGRYAEVDYGIYARVDIPLGFDLTFDGILPVALPEGAALAPLKGRVDRTKGFLRAEVEMMIDIERCELEPGRRLRGRVRVRNHSTKRIRGATIRLLALEEARAEGRERLAEHELNEGYLPAPDPSSPEQDIRFEIPINGPYPYRGGHSSVGYVVEAALDTALGRDTTVRVPLELE